MASATSRPSTRKKDADARHAEVKVDVKTGVHIAPSKSPTLKQAGESWLKVSEANGLERTTLDQYRQHLKYHLEPFIGSLKLSDITPPVVRKLEGDLLKAGRSKAMVRKVLVSLGSILADAQEQGLAARNAVRELRRNRRKGKERHAEKREKGKLKVGVDIPSPDEIKAILANAKGRWRPFLVTAAFTGLRASELRGPALGRRRPQGQRAARPAARRPLPRDRQAEIRGRSPHRAAPAIRDRHPARVEARAARPARYRVPQWPRAGSSFTSTSSSAGLSRHRSRLAS